MGNADGKSLPYLKIENECIACEWCRFNCPVEGCFTFDTPIANFHPELCIECSRCIYVCPVDVIIPLRTPDPKRFLPEIVDDESRP